MALVGVTQVLVLDDDHVSIADLFERAKPQVADAKLSYSHAADTTIKGKKRCNRKRRKKERFYDSLE